MIDSTRSIKACAAYYGENAEEMEAYLLDGEKRALELGNRGPIKFNENGEPKYMSLEDINFNFTVKDENERTLPLQ